MLPEDDILNVKTSINMLFVIIAFDIIVESLVKIVNMFNDVCHCRMSSDNITFLTLPGFGMIY